MSARRALGATLFVGGFGSIALASTVARATETGTPAGTDPDPNRLRSGFAAMTRPAGMAEGNVSLLTLPGAEVCAEQGSSCSNGDVVFAVEGWQFYRFNKRWAFGAGVMLGLIPTAHPKAPPEVIPRDHTRSYLTFEGMLRYYPYVGKNLEAWVGLAGGLVVVSDSFDVINTTDDRALLGGRGVTIRTEGGALGLATGFAYGLSEHWSLLGSLRFSQWFLPKTPARDPLGSEASLTGRNSALTLAFGVAYRATL